MNDINIEELIELSMKKVETLLIQQQYQEAEPLIAQVVKIDSNLQALQLYALVLYYLKKYEQSVEISLKAIDLNSNNAENYNNISLTYLQLNRFNDALFSQLKAVILKPDNFHFLNNLATTQLILEDFESSIKSFQKSLRINPNNVITLEGLGSAYGKNKEIDKALETFEKALKLDPSSLSAHVDLAYAYHLTGQWEKAWEEYEHRLEHWKDINKVSGMYYSTFPLDKRWDGVQSLKGKKFIVYCEQGIGDYIQFIRFVPKLKELGAEVYLEAANFLTPIFKNFGTMVTIKDLPDYDYHCSVLSLPYLLKLNSDQYLGDKIYIDVKDKFDLSDYNDKFKIGVVWGGNPAHPNDALRSCYLKLFKEIGNTPYVKLFSLQKDLRKRSYSVAPNLEIDLAEDCEDMKLVDMSSYLNDYYQTAKIINSLDLIITVDTSVLHLAGALGKETWALIAYNPDWRWTLNGDKTVWYDSVTLFRQESYKDWSVPFAKIQEKLEDRLKIKKARIGGLFKNETTSN